MNSIILFLKNCEVMILRSDNDKSIKEKIKKQDDLKLEFKRKLENIKVKYGVEFDITLLDNNNIDKIKFYNLEYKNKARDMSVIYYNESNYYGAYIYTVNKESTMKDESYIVKRNYLNKKYKLDMAINEIKQVNEIYRNKLLELENIQNELSSNDLNMEKELKRPTNTDNS